MSNKLLSRVRRNHALEHASINVLSEKHKKFSAQGNSTLRGFNLNIYADIAEQEVASAVEEAYERLKKGEEKLGLHPGCGTVRLTTATMASLAVIASLSIEQRRQRRASLHPLVILGALPSAILAATVALIASHPIGLKLQDRFTVEGDLGDMRLLSIDKVKPTIATRLFQFLLGQSKNEHVQSYRIITAD